MYDDGEDNSWSFAAGLFFGALIGAGIASLVTPRSGPQNRELVRDGENGLIVGDAARLGTAALERLLSRAPDIAQANRQWIAQHALFAPAVASFLQRLREIDRR